MELELNSPESKTSGSLLMTQVEYTDLDKVDVGQTQTEGCLYESKACDNLFCGYALRIQGRCEFVDWFSFPLVQAIGIGLEQGRVKVLLKVNSVAVVNWPIHKSRAGRPSTDSLQIVQ